nr:hypothetical protein [Tanacetum cinerariifolium]
MSYLIDYEEVDEGYVTFGGNPKRGKITGKDFKLIDESQVLPRVPRKNRNMSYLIDYEEVDEGYVTFGGNPKRGKITGK